MNMNEIVAIEYYDVDGSGPWTYAELMARQPERSEAEWARFEELERIVGRAHAEQTP